MARPILICFAVKEEAQPFIGRATSPPGIQVLVTGMGRRNAEPAVRAAISGGLPSLVLTAGFAGGLNPALGCGTILFDADPQSGLQAALAASGAVAARFHCADRVAVTAAEKQRLWKETGADAVEMESAAIRALCREHRVPAATVRVVLDTASQDLPLDFNALMDQDLRLDNRKLALAIAKSPGSIPALIRFQKQTRSAASALAETLHETLAGMIE